MAASAPNASAQQADSGHHDVAAPQETTPLIAQRRAARRRTPSGRGSSARTARTIVRGLIIVLLLATLALVVTVTLDEISQRRSKDPRAGRLYPAVLAQGKRGGVATENPICSNVGLDVLKDDGSAVDAAIASTLCIGVLNMFSAGIGGGGFMIVRNPEKCSSSSKLAHCAQHTTIDFRETAPAAANATMFKGRPLAARVGGLAVGVPGELRGLEEAHRRWGVLPWERLVRPSIKLAEGTKASKELARRLRFFGGFMLDNPDWAPIFVSNETGSLLLEGDIVRRPALAATLTKIAREGPDEFYEGEIGRSIIKKVQATGGVLSLSDLKSYKAHVLPALEGDWLGRRVFTTHAPTSGPVLLSVLNILSGFKGWVSDGLASGINTHHLIEALKHASAQRTEMADPAFLNASAVRRIAEIPTKKEAAYRRSRISEDRTHELDWYEPLFDVSSSHGTMHLSVIDKNGQAIAITSSVNLIFGSQVLDPETGIILNDIMDDASTPGVPNAFGLRPSPYNYPGPGKRPLSSMSPTILEHADGSVYMAIGGSGGSRIFTSVAQVLFNMDWGLDVSAAIERPRIHHQLLPQEVSSETTYDEDLLDALRSRGHEVAYTDINMGIAEVQAVVREGVGRLQRTYAASDSRKGGVAAAY